jgi:putative transposase
VRLLARHHLERRQNFTGQHFRERDYYVPTVGQNEATIKSYIQRQETEDCGLEQLSLFKD